jgi:hypothetical protein
MATSYALLANGLMLFQGRPVTGSVTDNGGWLTALVSQRLAIADLDAATAAALHLAGNGVIAAGVDDVVPLVVVAFEPSRARWSRRWR